MRGRDEFVSDADRVDWAAYRMAPSTDTYDPDRVPVAFRALVDTPDLAYNALMDAVAHNHSGWVYAAAAPAASFLARAAEEFPGQVRAMALEILTDLVNFAGDASFVSPAGETVHLRSAIRRAAQTLAPALTTWQTTAQAPDVVKGATALMATLQDFADEPLR